MQECHSTPISQATPDYLRFNVLSEVNQTSYPYVYVLDTRMALAWVQKLQLPPRFLRKTYKSKGFTPTGVK